MSDVIGKKLPGETRAGITNYNEYTKKLKK